MALLSYQRAAGLACVTLIIFLLLGYTTYHSQSLDTVPFSYGTVDDKQGASAPRPSSSSAAADAATSSSGQPWSFQSHRDAKNYGLSPQQCDAAFPKLWHELDRAVAHRKKTGNITPEEMNIGWKVDGIVRAMIYDRQLYILGTRGCRRRDYRERMLSVLQAIQRAITAYAGDLPNIEFTFTVDDGAYFAVYDNTTQATTWALTREPTEDNDNLWLMPDFGFYSWEGPAGEYTALLRAIEADEVPFPQKDRRAVWRGAKSPAGPVPVRADLLKVSKGKEWADIEEIRWDDKNSKGPSNLIPMSKHCKYTFPVHTEGHTYSGRLKYLLNCHSVSIIHKLHWVENFHHLLIPSGPEQNFIQVERDFSDLHWKISYYLEHMDEAEKVADNSIKTFRDRYLTPAAQACYWRKMFWAWREVSFEPEYYTTVEAQERELAEKVRIKEEQERLKKEKEVKNKLAKELPKGDARDGAISDKKPSKKTKGSKELVPRGMPYETFILIEAYEDSPWYDD